MSTDTGVGRVVNETMIKYVKYGYVIGRLVPMLEAYGKK